MKQNMTRKKFSLSDNGRKWLILAIGIAVALGSGVLMYMVLSVPILNASPMAFEQPVVYPQAPLVTEYTEGVRKYQHLPQFPETIRLDSSHYIDVPSGGVEMDGGITLFPCFGNVYLFYMKDTAGVDPATVRYTMASVASSDSADGLTEELRHDQEGFFFDIPVRYTAGCFYEKKDVSLCFVGYSFAVEDGIVYLYALSPDATTESLSDMAAMLNDCLITYRAEGDILSELDSEHGSTGDVRDSAVTAEVPDDIPAIPPTKIVDSAHKSEGSALSTHERIMKNRYSRFLGDEVKGEHYSCNIDKPFECMRFVFSFDTTAKDMGDTILIDPDGKQYGPQSIGLDNVVFIVDDAAAGKWIIASPVEVSGRGFSVEEQSIYEAVRARQHDAIFGSGGERE